MHLHGMILTSCQLTSSTTGALRQPILHVQTPDNMKLSHLLLHVPQQAKPGSWLPTSFPQGCSLQARRMTGQHEAAQAARAPGSGRPGAFGGPVSTGPAGAVHEVHGLCTQEGPASWLSGCRLWQCCRMRACWPCGLQAPCSRPAEGRQAATQHTRSVTYILSRQSNAPIWLIPIGACDMLQGHVCRGLRCHGSESTKPETRFTGPCGAKS